MAYTALQFAAYRSMTVVLQGTTTTITPTATPQLPRAAESFVSGATASALATTATYPLDLLRTRFAAQGRTRVYPSLHRAILHILCDEGPRGFYAGLGPTLGQIVPYMGLFFAVYETARPLCARFSRPLSAVGSGDAAVAGVVAGVVAKTAVFPLDLVRKRIQVQGPTRTRYAHGAALPEYSAGAARALASIVATEGVRGLYRGLTISLVKAAPLSAVTLWSYESSLGVMLRLSQERENTVRST